MRSSHGRRLRRSLPALAGVLLLLAASFLTACGDDEEPAAANAVQRMRQVVGAKPGGLAATVAGRGSLLIAVTPDYPPFSYVDDDGELTGFDVEVGEAVAEYLKLTPRFTEPVWEAVPAGLAGDRFDVSIGSLSPEQGLSGEIAFTKPYYYTEGRLAVQAGAAGLDGVEALAGKRIGAGVHTVFYRWLQAREDIEAVAYPSDAEAIAGLEAGRVDGIVLSALAARQAIEEGRGIELSGGPLVSIPMTFVVKKGEKDFLKAMNATIAALRQDGTLAELSRRWFDDQDYTRPRGASSPSP